MKRNDKIQILRAIAIIAVVLIHTCPNGNFQYICRPFINFAVATFLFLSGYLTKIEKTKEQGFYKKRIFRVLIPYIIWSLIYSLASFESIGKLFLNLITTKSAATLYYIYVYIQFVVLTPLLYKIACSKYRWMIWIIPILSIIIFEYYYWISGNEINKYLSVIWDVSCLGWVGYYYLGLLLGNKIINVSITAKKLLVLLIISIPLQIVEGYWLFNIGEENCGTQLKFTSLITSTITMLLFYKFLANNKIKCTNKFLILIGDYSFGIYLSHILIMKILSKLPLYPNIPYIINSLIIVLISLFCAYIGNKICHKKISKYIGLS